MWGSGCVSLLWCGGVVRQESVVLVQLCWCAGVVCSWVALVRFACALGSLFARNETVNTVWVSSLLAPTEVKS